MAVRQFLDVGGGVIKMHWRIVAACREFTLEWPDRVLGMNRRRAEASPAWGRTSKKQALFGGLRLANC